MDIHLSGRYVTKLPPSIWTVMIASDRAKSPRPTITASRLGVALALATLVASCGQQQPQGGPPPPAVNVTTPVTRTVTDASGSVIHSDTWVSHYAMMRGLIQYGVAAAPPPSPTPAAPTPAPAVTPTP